MIDLLVVWWLDVEEVVVVCDAGRWLVDHRAELDRAEALWLERLAEFDRDGLWAADGQLSCTSWLVWKTGMARSTAFDKVRVARELARRPVVAEAFKAGRLSYSAVRAMTRMDRPDPAVDEALVALARDGEASIMDLERVARSYRRYADQERPPADEAGPMRDVKIRRGDDGVGQVIITLRDVEIEEFAAVIQAFLDLRYRPGAVDESSAEDCGHGGGPKALEAPLDEPSRAEMKVDAFMDLVATALAHADQGAAAGDDRYMVHLVSRPDQRGLATLDGRPIHPVDAATIACDSSGVTHETGVDGEPLRLGRKTRQWNTAQRRAISVRDGGHCRFVGCQHRHYDIHHLQAWEDDGLTDIDNGICQCPRHHRMLHSGYHTQGDPNQELRFYRPDGTYIGSTRATAISRTSR